MRLANSRLAASRARLRYGHEALSLNRPRTHAGRSRLHQNRAAGKTRLKATHVHVCQGPRAARGLRCPLFTPWKMTFYPVDTNLGTAALLLDETPGNYN